MQTILGAGGVIGKGLAAELHKYTDRIRLVSRKPLATTAGEEWMAGDLTKRDDVLQAVAGSKVVYLVAGLRYHTETWKVQWPQIMQNVLEACETHEASLVFFDNVYAYGLVPGAMTEETPMRPCSKKGEVRRQIATMLLNRMADGRVNALIARAADFYGPDAPQSLAQIMVFDKLAKGKTPQWIITDKKVHSFTYTPDAARATALLGNTPMAFGQVWHLPTDAQHLTGREFINLAAEVFGRPSLRQLLPAFMMRALGLFVEALRESWEMNYQIEHDYRFDSSKFFKAFPNFGWKSYRQGMEEVAAWYGGG
jgi:nucleoside-diphosphate-sugar epimerase